MELAPSPRDARDRPLQEGDELVILQGAPVYLRVLKIEPSVDPRDPPTALLVTLAAIFKTVRGQINPEFIRVRTLEEIEGGLKVKMTSGETGGPDGA